MKKLERTTKGRFLGGVCGGIGEYSNIDPVIIRLILVLLTIWGAGLTVIAYVIAWIIMPQKSEIEKEEIETETEESESEN